MLPDASIEPDTDNAWAADAEAGICTTFKDDGTNSCYTGKTYHFPTLQLDYDKDESAANQTQKEGIHNTMNSEDN